MSPRRSRLRDSVLCEQFSPAATSWFDSKAGVEAVRRKAAISAAYPFEREVTGHHSYVAFMTDEQVLDELAALADGAGPEEKIQRYESSTTTRNLRTLAEVLG